MSLSRRLLLKLFGGATISATAAAASSREVPIKAPEPTGALSKHSRRLIVPRNTNCFFSLDWKPIVVYDDGEPVPEEKLLVMDEYLHDRPKAYMRLDLWSVEVRA